MKRQAPDGRARKDVRAVIELVSAYTGVSREVLLGSTKHRDTSDARQLSMWVARRCTSASFLEIARQHNRHHSTVIHAIRAVQARIDTIIGYKRFVAGVEKIAARRTGIEPP
jgi:chromosomal replication initiation ATPase DnaA